MKKQYTRQEKVKAIGWLTLQLLPLILAVSGYFLMHRLCSAPEEKQLLPIADLGLSIIVLMWLIRIIFSMINQTAQLVIIASFFPIPGMGLIALAIAHFGSREE